MHTPITSTRPALRARHVMRTAARRKVAWIFRSSLYPRTPTQLRTLVLPTRGAGFARDTSAGERWPCVGAGNRGTHNFSVDQEAGIEETGRPKHGRWQQEHARYERFVFSRYFTFVRLLFDGLID